MPEVLFSSKYLFMFETDFSPHVLFLLCAGYTWLCPLTNWNSKYLTFFKYFRFSSRSEFFIFHFFKTLNFSVIFGKKIICLYWVASVKKHIYFTSKKFVLLCKLSCVSYGNPWHVTTIELTAHTSCYCVLDLLFVMLYISDIFKFHITSNGDLSIEQAKI